MSDVVLYLRYSSDKQTEQSIEGQRRVCRDFCTRNGYNIVGEYIDRAKSASKETAKRAGFFKMLKDSEKGKWQGVVVYKLDRFARNRYDSATYKAKLKKNGVKVISATENISDSPEGIILESVLEGMAEFYSAELSQKVSRGMNETALKCNSTGGTLPLGYKVENKKLVIDEPRAAIVREVFDRYVSGETITSIVDDLNRRGLRTAKGKTFNKCSFTTMFKNEKYIGVYSYNGIKIEGGIPAIVDKETFERANKRMKTYKHAPGAGKARVDYLLSQKLYCGHCGAKMIGHSGHNGTGNIYHYYICPNQHKHTCDKKSMPKDKLETAVAEHLLKKFTPEFIDTLADMAIKQQDEDLAANEVIPALEADIEDVENKISNLMKVMESGVHSDSVIRRMTELEEEKDALLAQLEDAKENILILEKPHIVWFLTRFSQGNLEDETFKRSLFEMLIERVVVWDDPDGYRLTIVYNLTDNNTEEFPCSLLEFDGSPSKTKPNIVARWAVYQVKIHA